MSKIQSLAPNYQAKTNLNQNFKQNQSKEKFGQNPNFGCEVLTEAQMKIVKKGVEAKMDAKIGWLHKLYKRLYDHDGELQTQLINALFTTTLAPTFIALNPFSKEDKKTKQYTAVRQPISAGIAISGGVLMTVGINSWMSQIASDGHIKSIDLRMRPEATYYLKRQYKRGYKGDNDPAVNSEAEFIAKYDKGLDPEIIAKKGRDYKKARFENYIKIKHEERTNFFTKLISEDPTTISIDEKTKIITCQGKEIGRNIPNMGTDPELRAYLKDNNLHIVTFRDFMRDQFKFEFFEDGTVKPHSVEARMDKISALEFLRKTGLIKGKELTEEDLTASLSRIRQKTVTLKEFEEALVNVDATYKPGGALKTIEALSKESSRNLHVKVGDKVKDAEIATLRNLFDRLGIKGKDLNKLMIGTVAESLKAFSETHLADLSRVKNPGEKALEKVFAGKTISDFALNLVRNKATRAAGDFKNYGKYAGIGFNIITTAITCTILNWAYPRIVERFFPSLVKDDAPKGGNK